MEISCPECSKKYKVDDSLIPDKGRKVKCKKCGSVFFVQKENKKEENSEFNLDLDFGQVQNPVGEGTVRISREQIQASIQNPVQQNEEITTQEDNVQLDIEDKFSESQNVQQMAVKESEGEVNNQLNEELYKVKIENQIFKSISVDQIKEWIEEDRLLETDLIAREGSENWIEVEKVPKFKKVIDMHVYAQRKILEQEDNPYKKFQNQQKVEVKKESFFQKIMSIFKKG